MIVDSGNQLLSRFLTTFPFDQPYIFIADKDKQYIYKMYVIKIKQK